MKKYAYLWLLLIAGLCVIGWKLCANKKSIENEARISLVGRAHVPVEVLRPQMERLSNRLETNGIFLPAKEMFVISETAGRIVSVNKNKGEWVKEGEVIAKVDEEILRIELDATEANIAKLKKDKERLDNLISGDAVPKNKIEDIELGLLAAEAKQKGLQKQIANTSIKAPMTGTMGLRFIERGSVIGPGIQVAQITNLEKLFLMVKVIERDILQVKKGQAVTVFADVYPSRAIQGKVTNIGLRADNAFNYDVEIEVPNLPGQPLRAGMHAKAIFEFSNNRRGLVLPRKAITGSLQDAKVYVVENDSIALERPVKLGVSAGEKVEVTAGLSEGERVVVSGQMNLHQGARVQIVKEQ